MRTQLWHSPALIPAAAAVVAFVAALALGMTTKSGSVPQAGTSLAPPVEIQAPQASVAAVQRDVPTPALARTAPAPRKQPPAKTASSSTATASTASTVTQTPTTGVAHTPTTGVAHTPTTGVVHSPTTGVVHSPGGGSSGVVHGGN